MEANLPAEGVGKFKIRQALSNSRARACACRQACPHGVINRCRSVKTQVISFHDVLAHCND